MPNELIILGSSGGAVALVALGGAAIETVRMVYNSVIREPLPTEFTQLLDQMGGENANNSSNSASS